ncbi:ankyrin repeat and SAM domain-containing protein 1A-like [Macrosteles quadrilineatus]|uniref:ankyrin repeat and SAM domain-containing protein 1A-like n=1 Tax=Macrosteles quadrilineatus TaxID=74068 RepID=UPI0023E1251B|nr:ankyrin repeat and SAM domain-containing protein 1A-like [Macrosteles quadrilineatus]
MGKDQELLEAARNGNTPVVEKILSQRAKRSGPLASLRRGPGANVQDSSGYSALHHAALNGHKNIVQLLLTHEASTNIVDVKGSSPLHLAAWTGNVDIVRLLLTHGPSVPNVNLTTKDRETALHCAAQYGHTAVVSQLLEHSCDPTIRNSRHETALDLAAQYGRLETVELLVRTHPELLQPYLSNQGSSPPFTFPHTPLHLASRNGHKAVVEVLLSAGMDVNVRTAAGSALHEAALCGKTEVVRTLLEHGVDLGIRDEQRNTVTDLLKQFPTHVVQDIITIISRFRAVHGDQSLPPIPVPSLGSPYENVRVPPSHSPTQWDRRVSASSAISIGSGNDGLRHYGLSKSLMDSLEGRDLDQMSVSSTASSTGGPSPRDIYLPMAPSQPSPTANNKVSPTPPKKPPRRNLSVSPTHLMPLMSVSADHHQSPSAHAYEYLFLARSGVRSHGDLDEMMACAKLRRGVSADQYVDMKLRRSMVSESDDKYEPVAITSLYENMPVRTTNPRRKLRRITDKSYENCDPSVILSRGDLPFRKVEAYSPATSDSPIFVSSAYITFKSSQESLLNGDHKKPPSNCPLSPTHYQQPPTPDHPPPSALEAERSIHQRIRPLSQEYCNMMKRRSRDMETETDEELLLLVFPANTPADHSSGSLSSSVSLSDKSVSTDNNQVEEYIGDVPFAGLLKGSTTTDGVGSARAERPKTLRRLRAVYDQGQGSAASDMKQRPPEDPSSGPGCGVLSPFDEQEEWAKISEIMASFGTGLVRESVFVTELEKEFQARLGVSGLNRSDSGASIVSTTSTVAQWLAGMGLADYESLFTNYGYDDLDFINGVLEDSDLVDMGVSNEKERGQILEAARSLAAKVVSAYRPSPSPAPPPNNNNNEESNGGNSGDKTDSQSEPAQTVEDWLSRLHLPQYADTFSRHLYTDMERVRRIWEVELTAVLEISKPGHRRRILASLPASSRQPPSMDSINQDLSNLKNNIHQLKEEIKTKLPSNQSTPGSTGTLRHSHKKSRPAPPPPPLGGGDLEIREPSQLLVGVPATLTTQWRHQPHSLVTGHVTYLAKYLGSTLVKELRGTESTKKSIQKLKKSSSSDDKEKVIPEIILAISFRGVKFLNPSNQEVICEHDIRNIHCACQDAEDLTHFAYITKDHSSKSHFCHVFCVNSMDQATEVILTLGQAFEVAYQMALREGCRDSRGNGHTRSRSVNQITTTTLSAPVTTQPQTNSHSRSHSVNEIKVNGSVTPPTTPGRAPIVTSDDV